MIQFLPSRPPDLDRPTRLVADPSTMPPMTDRLDKLRQLHEADPDDPELTYMIALEHSKQDRLDEALEWLTRTIQLDAHYHYAYFQKGKMLGALNRDAEAREVLEQGLNRANSKGDAKAAGELAELLASMTG